MAKQLTHAAPKFSAYAHARKVVLLDFYGDSLFEDDIPPLLSRTSVPDCIDEIWMTTREWVSEDEYRCIRLLLTAKPSLRCLIWGLPP